MILAKNKQTGEIQEVDDSQLGEIVSSGQFEVEDKSYKFEDDEGQRRNVRTHELKKAIDLGYRHIPADQLKKEELQEKYGDQPLKAGAVGLAGGVSLGIIPPLLEKTGLVEPEEMEILKQSPAYTAGEVTGAVGSIILGGGTGVVAKGASMLPTAILAKGASKVGSRMAQTINSQIAKNAVALGVEGAVEGGVYGGVSALTEEALGDSEFNAESVMWRAGAGAIMGGAVGSALGSGSAALVKATRAGQRKVMDRVINQVDGDAAFKAEVKQKLADQDAIQDGLLSLKDPEIQAIKAKYPDAPTTPGMESAFRPVKQIENYLFDAPTAQGEGIRKSVNEIQDYVSRNVDAIWTGAKEASPEETGNLIRQTFFTSINQPREAGKVVYSAIMDEFGGAPVMQAMRTRVANRIKKSDAYRIGSEGPEIKRLLGILEDGQELTLKQAKNLQSDIGASMKMAKPGSAERELLQDLYDQVRMLQDNSIRMALKGSKGEQGLKVVRALDAANAEYVRAYKAKTEIAELFGIRGRDFDTVLDKLESMSAVDLERKFMTLKKSDHAAKVLAKYPEVGKLVIRNRQSQLLKKNLLQGGEYNYAGIKKDLLKMNPEERELYFGGDKKAMEKFMDMLTIYEKRPKTLNPSGTDIRQEIRDMLSPKAITQKWMLGEIYKGNDSFIGRMVNRVLPNLNGIEQSANAVKNQVVTASNGFMRSLAPMAAVGVLSRPNEASIKKTEKTYQLIQENPDKFVEDYLRDNRDLMDAAPKTGQALQQKIISAAQFLQSKVPKTDDGYIGQKRSPSRIELTQFGEYVQAVESPKKVLDNISKGYVSPAQVEALKAIYPKIYAALQAEMINRVPKAMSRAQRSQLQLLIGAKVTPSMSPNGFGILQGRVAPPMEESSPVENSSPKAVSPTVGGLSKIEHAGRSSGTLDKVINRRA